jgi:hypothetical protein
VLMLNAINRAMIRENENTILFFNDNLSKTLIGTVPANMVFDCL